MNHEQLANFLVDSILLISAGCALVTIFFLVKTLRIAARNKKQLALAYPSFSDDRVNALFAVNTLNLAGEEYLSILMRLTDLQEDCAPTAKVVKLDNRRLSGPVVGSLGMLVSVFNTVSPRAQVVNNNIAPKLAMFDF